MKKRKQQKKGRYDFEIKVETPVTNMYWRLKITTYLGKKMPGGRWVGGNYGIDFS